jgi:hypothetical protein
MLPYLTYVTEMAARTNKPLHDDKTKALIRASQLLNRLNSFAQGEVEMTAAQVQAAKIVIGKVIPDLKSVEHTGNSDKPVQVSIAWMNAPIS